MITLRVLLGLAGPGFCFLWWAVVGIARWAESHGVRRPAAGIVLVVWARREG